MIIDVDLKIQEEDDNKTSFLYEKQNIKELIRIITKVLEENLEEDDKIDENTFNCYVMERAPYKMEKNGNKWTKNGFHLHFPFIFLAKTDIILHVIPRVEQLMIEEKIELPLGCDNYKDLIDKNVYGKKAKHGFYMDQQK